MVKENIFWTLRSPSVLADIGIHRLLTTQDAFASTLMGFRAYQRELPQKRPEIAK